jgi:hypothetical protein
MKDFSFSIDVPVKNQWSNIDRLRTSVQSCLEAVFIDIAGCEALAMVTGELLENAIKYGDWSQESVFRLRVWGDEKSGAISVENPVATGDEGPERVFAAVRFVESFPTAEEAYQAKLLDVARRPERTPGGLGLARVAHEGGCKLEAVLDGKILRVTARLLPAIT